ncbi:MAG TPA: hypothetical protein ENN32_08490 [Chloroflexi bacterium]|nr:hypothetical protein [Chloroflexota bacterium]
MTQSITGKWVQIEGQAYAGLWFDFKDDGTFVAEYAPLGVVSSGTYTIDGDGLITIQQKKHTFGLLGEFPGVYAIDGNELKMALSSAAGQPRPKDLSEARIYHKAQD